MPLSGLLLLLCLLHTGESLEVSAPPSHRAVLGGEVSIPCSFTVQKPPIQPRFLAIFWFFQEKEILTVHNSIVRPAERRVSYRGQAEAGSADLTISNLTVTDGGIYRCSILYSPDKRDKEIRLDVQAPPLITITNRVVVKGKESVLRGSVSGFYPVDIDIKWLRDGETLSDVTVEKPQRHPDGTYSVRSSVTMTPSEGDRRSSFSCIVQHDSLPAPLREDFRLLYGAPPSVHITPRAFKLNAEQAVVCSVSGFYPESIAAHWLLNGTLVETAKTQRISSSEVESVYRFLPTDKTWGAELACVVEHETLSTPHVERLLVEGKDPKARYKVHIVTVAVLLVTSLGAFTIFLLLLKQRKKSLPKVRRITRWAGGTFSLDVDHLYSKDMTVSWEVLQPPSGPQARPLSSTIIYHQNQDGSHNATSTSESLRGAVQEDEPYVVRAVVTHGKLKRPAHREFSSYGKGDTGFLSPPEVQPIQTPAMLLEKEAELRCVISGFYPDALTLSWFRQIGEEESELRTDQRHRIIQGLSTQQQDKTFSCTASLWLTPTLEDLGADIICRVAHPGLKQLRESRSGPLRLLVKPGVPRPIHLSITEAGDMVASVSLCNFHPEGLTLCWTYGDPQQKRPSEETVSNNPDGTFTVSSRCTIPGSLFENPQFTVRATWEHPAMERPDHREVSTADPDFPWHPRIISLTPLIVQECQESRIVSTISGYFSKKLRVSWLDKKGRTVSDRTHGYTIPAIQHTKMADNSYRCSPSLSFTPSSVTEDLEFICTVEHPSLQHPVTLSTGPPTVKVAPQMKGKVTLTPSGPHRVLCTLRLEKFYPENIEISWTFGEENPTSLPSTKKIIRTNDEKTLDARSECEVSWKGLLESGLRVTWNHDSLRRAESRDVSLSDYPWKPLLGDIERPLLVVSTACTLQCHISGYFPAELTVSWHKKRKGDEQTLTNGERYKILCPRHQRQPDDTYSCTARMTFTPILLEDEGSEFICRAELPQHRGLTERSTGILHMSDFLARPEIEMIKTPTLFLQEETHLQCRISRFYPDQLTVTWLKKEKGKEELSLLPTRGQRRPPDRHSEQQPDKTFSCTALQPFTPSLEDDGAQLLCRVQHPSLEHPLEIKTAPIQIIGLDTGKSHNRRSHSAPSTPTTVSGLQSPAWELTRGDVTPHSLIDVTTLDSAPQLSHCP